MATRNDTFVMRIPKDNSLVPVKNTSQMLTKTVQNLHSPRAKKALCLLEEALSDTAQETTQQLLKQVENIRLDANNLLDNERRKTLGQFMTPLPLAKLMASMFDDLEGEVHILDAGAGVGSLTSALVAETLFRNQSSQAITAHSFELDALLTKHLETSIALCQQACLVRGVTFSAHIRNDDFVEQASTLLRSDLFSKRLQPRFNKAILNPPYCKINSNSNTRRQLRSVGIETVNLYAAFVALAIKLLEPGGELVAITPRSFCNGPYFKPFRQLLLSEMTVKKIHIFDSRNKTFKEDSVLQENIILHAIKEKRAVPIKIISSACAEDKEIFCRQVPQDEVVCSDDPELFIHITATEKCGAIALRARSLPCSLEDLDIQVSTGRVVDFRAKEYLAMEPDSSTVPLIYPAHFEQGNIVWPKNNHRKPNALIYCPETKDLAVPSGVYTLAKRFSSKEERRRIVAAVYDPKKIQADNVGFENHLNYFHCHGQGLTRNLAKGLALFLNSSLVDQYFRQFNGHTQVNATDLRTLRYPTKKQLNLLGKHFKSQLPSQEKIDRLIDELLKSYTQSTENVSAK